MSQRKKNSEKPAPPKSPPPRLCSKNGNEESKEEKNTSKLKNKDRDSKINQPSSSDNNESKDNKDIVKEIQELESSTMSEILSEDEKLLFSLQVVGSLQKNEKLMNKNGLPSVDDRYFQGLGRRWYSGDNRHKTSDLIFQLSSDTLARVQILLEEDYRSRLQEGRQAEKKVSIIGAENKETPDQKKFRECCEDRRRTISRFFEALSKTKQGIENLRETYSDKFVKEKLSLALSKVDETLEKLRKAQ